MELRIELTEQEFEILKEGVPGACKQWHLENNVSVRKQVEISLAMLAGDSKRAIEVLKESITKGAQNEVEEIGTIITGKLLAARRESGQRAAADQATEILNNEPKPNGRN